MAQAINEQINKELFSAYMYKAMSLQAKGEGLNGTASWLDIQTKEEIEHAAKFENYLLDQNCDVEMGAIDKPDAKFKDLKELFEKVLAHEKIVSASILNLVKLARKNDDVATEIMLQWFVTEQVEEEKNPTEILQKIERIHGSSGGLYMLDKELGKRGRD
jgi:ferritin